MYCCNTQLITSSWKLILEPSACKFGYARVSSGKLCARNRVAKIWLFGPHSACSLIQPKLFASFIGLLECFHMRSRRPYWCPKTMKRPPCWCPKPILWELNSFLMETLSSVPINLHRCWPREWKHSITILISTSSQKSCAASVLELKKFI